MDILTERQKLAMSFIAAANRGGHRPHIDDVQEWLQNPAPRTHLRAFSAWQQQLFNLGQQFSYSLGGTTSNETTTASLVRLRWAVSDVSENLHLSDLGAALLRSSEMLDEDAAVATTVVLGADDQLAYPQVVHRLAQAEGGALVDPYLRLEQIAQIATTTSITRFLISEMARKEDKAAIKVFVERYSGGPIEVRVGKRTDLHDRLIVCEAFVDTIGTSLNSIGAGRPTVLSPLPERAANAMRAYFSECWDKAEVLAVHAPDAEETAVDDSDADQSSKDGDPD